MWSEGVWSDMTWISGQSLKIAHFDCYGKHALPPTSCEGDGFAQGGQVGTNKVGTEMQNSPGTPYNKVQQAVFDRGVPRTAIHVTLRCGGRGSAASRVVDTYVPSRDGLPVVNQRERVYGMMPDKNLSRRENHAADRVYESTTP